MCIRTDKSPQVTEDVTKESQFWIGPHGIQSGILPVHRYKRIEEKTRNFKFKKWTSSDFVKLDLGVNCVIDTTGNGHYVVSVGCTQCSGSIWTMVYVIVSVLLWFIMFSTVPMWLCGNYEQCVYRIVQGLRGSDMETWDIQRYRYILYSVQLGLL